LIIYFQGVLYTNWHLRLFYGAICNNRDGKIAYESETKQKKWWWRVL